MTNLLVVGSSIVGSGIDPDETLFRVDSMNEAIDATIDFIERERGGLERERASDKHWKYIDAFRFFIGTLENEKTIPAFDCGSYGEILVDGVDMIFDEEFAIDDDFDFDEIINRLNAMRT